MIFRTYYPASRKLLLDNVSEIDIFRIWCKDFKALDKPFRSPIIISGSSNSNNGSAVIGYANGHLVFRDFRIGRSFGSIQFASEMTSLSGNSLVQYLCEYFSLNVDHEFFETKQPKYEKTIDIKQVEKQISRIDVKYKHWNNEELEYWGNHGWTKDMLDRCRIHPVSHFFLWKDDNRIEYNRRITKSMSFSYDFGEMDGVFRRKVYSPQAKRGLKWFTNSNRMTIQGSSTIDSHVKTLFLTSSMKDIGPFWRILGHPCAVAPNSESALLSVEQVRWARQISDRQIIWYDNDGPGILNSIKQANMYGFESMMNPHGSHKDPSDYVNKRGLRDFNRILQGHI